MTLAVPPFVRVAHDESQRKASFTVEDPEIAHQRAMWGESRAQLLNVHQEGV